MIIQIYLLIYALWMENNYYNDYDYDNNYD